MTEKVHMASNYILAGQNISSDIKTAFQNPLGFLDSWVLDLKTHLLVADSVTRWHAWL